jgi:uncharacterized protein (DUF952 family)
LSQKTTYHITSAIEWQEAQAIGAYQPQAFAQEQFIHLSYGHQILTVAHRFYAEQRGLVILVIDSSRIKDGLIEENLEGGVELYPHFYGVLPVDAVINAIAFPCNADGSFDLPIELNI